MNIKADYVRAAIAAEASMPYCEARIGAYVCSLPPGHVGKHKPAHTCHWPGCDKRVPPAAWGCRPHWYRLPQSLRNAIWEAYQPGQEITKKPSTEYVHVANQVQEWILQHFPDSRQKDLL